MPRALTAILPADDAGIAQAAGLLRAGRLVAFGTETVYGLGGRADQQAVVLAIYHAKQRPPANPLICHYPDAQAAAADAVFDARADRLAARFWPGPLTLVLPRRDGARVAAAASPPDTLAVRVPAPAPTRALLRQVGVGVVAPSANMSGRVSPVTAAHVLDGLGGRIDAVLECGTCVVGLESTVIDLTGTVPLLLRAGAVESAAVASVLGCALQAPAANGVLRGPGQLARHYAPLLKLRLDADEAAADEALLALGPPRGPAGLVFQLSAAGDLAEAGSRLFTGLRWLDREGAARGLRGIAVMKVPMSGLGCAINDRLMRAASV